jgi:hypothetical protein
MTGSSFLAPTNALSALFLDDGEKKTKSTKAPKATKAKESKEPKEPKAPKAKKANATDDEKPKAAKKPAVKKPKKVITSDGESDGEDIAVASPVAAKARTVRQRSKSTPSYSGLSFSPAHTLFV